PTYFTDNSNFQDFGYIGDPAFDKLSGPLTDPNQLNVANALQSDLAGLIGEGENTFNVTSKTSGFVPGAPTINTLNYNNFSGYLTDQWRVTPRLTLNLGLRYELFTGLTDPSGLRLEVVIPPGLSPTAALLSPTGTFDFVGGNAGKQGEFFKSDKNNFAPILGVAYSPNFKNGFLRRIFPGD